MNQEIVMFTRTFIACFTACLLISSGCEDDPVDGNINEEDSTQTLDTSGTDGGEDSSSADSSTADSSGADVSGDTSIPDTGGTDTSVADTGSSDTSTGDTGTDTPVIPDPTSEDCSNGVDDDDDQDVDCDDADCDATPVCTAEICDNGTDDDRDNDTDCDDFECRTDPACLVENCTNGKDDNGDNQSDCDDATCASHPSCTNLAEVCDNGTDDDGDGLTDCRDTDCWDTTNTDNVTCTNPTNAVTCTAEGQQCNPQAGAQQGDFFCAQPGIPNLTDGYPGRGICLTVCQPADPSSCPFGQGCFDPNPNDNQPGGLCFATQCNEPFSTNGCPNGEECTPYANGYLYCDAIGTIAEGETCTPGFFAPPNEKCDEDLACINGICRASCDLASPSCTDTTQTCLPIFSDVGYGLCDVDCPAFSNGACDTDEACVATLADVWVCRPDPGLGLGEACPPNNFNSCSEGLVCAFGECQPACSFFASGDCADTETCVGFDAQAQFGVCAEACEDYIPETCTDTEERCVDLGSGNFACQPHGGVGEGDACTNFVQCGQELYCTGTPNQPGTCEQLCKPFDTGSTCGQNTACLPFNSELGGCSPTTRMGTAQDDTCNPQNALCGDELYCGQGFGGQNVCYQICRVDQNDPITGRDNPDCANTTDFCDPQFGWEDLGICVP